MKQLLKVIVQKYIGLFCFRIIRPFFTPSAQLRKSLLFTGRFKVRIDKEHSFVLHNNRFYLETNFFWLGYHGYEWENQTRQLWAFLSQTSSVIMDVGSNTGIYSLIANTLNPNAVVHAFEPQPNVFKNLQRNVQINNLSIECHEIALSDAEGTLPFYNYGPDTFYSLNTTAGSLNKDWKPEDQSSISVKVNKLEKLVPELDIPSIDLMKIDVETHEYNVLRGYGNLLQIHKPIIILEIQSDQIGAQVSSLFKDQFVFYHIDEESGLRKVETLATSSKYKNFVICTEEKNHLIEKYLSA